MPRSYRYLQLDVFTGHLFGGNQLAVFLDGRGLADGTMQAVAREMNFSETTFILPPEHPDTDVRMRIFTPGAEMPIAGHPTIGSTFALAREGVIAAGSGRFVFGLGAGPTPVRLSWRQADLAFAWMTQPLPTFHEPIPDRELAAAALGLEADAVTGTGLPVQAVSCGVPFVFVPPGDAASGRQRGDQSAGLPRADEAAARGRERHLLFHAGTRSRLGNRLQPELRAGHRHCRGSRNGDSERAAGLLSCSAQGGGTGAGGHDAEPAGREDGPPEPRACLDWRRKRRDPIGRGRWRGGSRR
jgi:predicted PhzF superfamily epimerase YddE/YHI9